MKNGILKSGKILSLLLCSVLVITGCKTAQSTASSGNTAQNSPRRGGPGGGDEMKSFSEIVTGEAESDEGVFNVHKVKDKYYFEITNDMLEREMLLVTRVSGSTENFSFGGAGQKARQQQVIRWQRKENNIKLRHDDVVNLLKIPFQDYRPPVGSKFGGEKEELKTDRSATPRND